MSSDDGYTIRQQQENEFYLDHWQGETPGIPVAGSFSTREEAISYFLAGDYYSEYGLSFDLIKKEKQVETSKFLSKPREVEAVRVTEENLEAVANWAMGELHDHPFNGRPVYIKIDVKNPLHDRQTRAYIGDWVLKGSRGFKVYTNKAFLHNFRESSGWSSYLSNPPSVNQNYGKVDFVSAHPSPQELIDNRNRLDVQNQSVKRSDFILVDGGHGYNAWVQEQIEKKLREEAEEVKRVAGETVANIFSGDSYEGMPGRFDPDFPEVDPKEQISGKA